MSYGGTDIWHPKAAGITCLRKSMQVFGQGTLVLEILDVSPFLCQPAGTNLQLPPKPVWIAH